MTRIADLATSIGFPGDRHVAPAIFGFNQIEPIQRLPCPYGSSFSLLISSRACLPFSESEAKKVAHASHNQRVATDFSAQCAFHSVVALRTPVNCCDNLSISLSGHSNTVEFIEHSAAIQHQKNTLSNRGIVHTSKAPSGHHSSDPSPQ
ncbi:hypothetical protein VTK26DRAFT_8835 [Humicola hyalothermophila]